MIQLYIYMYMLLFRLFSHIDHYRVFIRWLSGKESACSAEDVGLIPVWGRSSGEGKGHSLQWKIPWTEEPGELSPWGHKEVDMT